MEINKIGNILYLPEDESKRVGRNGHQVKNTTSLGNPSRLQTAVEAAPPTRHLNAVHQLPELDAPPSTITWMSGNRPRK